MIAISNSGKGKPELGATWDTEELQKKISYRRVREDSVAKTFIEALPKQLAKETVYVVDSCYSGQFHEWWPKNCENSMLLTASGANEFNHMSLLQEGLPHDCKPVSIKNFADYYDWIRKPKKSTPYISGYYKGREYENTKLETFCDLVRSIPTCNITDAIVISNLLAIKEMVKVLEMVKEQAKKDGTLTQGGQEVLNEHTKELGQKLSKVFASGS